MPSTSQPSPEDSVEVPPLKDENLDTHVADSNVKKHNGNLEFGSGKYSDAIQSYEDALSDLTTTKAEFEKGVLKANIVACWVKLEEWEKAAEVAGEAMEALERADPKCAGKDREEVGEGRRKRKRDGGEKGQVGEEGGSRRDGENKAGEENHGDGEQMEDGEPKDDDEEERDIRESSDEGEVLSRRAILTYHGHNEEDIERMRVKVLLRRATARSRLGGWAALQGADEDYKQLEKMPQLSATDRKVVQKALKELPPRLDEAKQKEMSDMMGKLKQLGNGILKPFGLSTDNFSMVKDEKSGSYSLQFNQNG